MFARDDRVAKGVILQAELDQGGRQRLAFCQAEARADRSSGDIAHHHLDRNDLQRADQLFAVVHPFDEMRGDAGVRQAQHDVLADMVVQHTLAGDDIFLLGVEGGGVVLEILDQCAVLRPLEDDLGLAFVEWLARAHQPAPPLAGAPNTRAKIVSTWRKCWSRSNSASISASVRLAETSASAFSLSR